MISDKQFNQYSILNKDTFEQIHKLAQILHKANFNKSLDSVEKYFIAIQLSIEFEMPMTQFVQNITCVMGKFAFSTDMMLALVQRSKQLEYIEEKIETIDGVVTAVCTVKRKGLNPSTRYFSMENAKDAKLWNKPIGWQGYPARMLQIRARGFALRDNFSDVLLGLQHSAEELKDPGEEDLNLTPINEIIESIELNNEPFSNEKIKIKIEELSSTIINKIEEIKTQEDHDKYQIWSNNNKKIFAEFIMKEEQIQIGKLYQNKKNQIHKEEKKESDTE